MGGVLDGALYYLSFTDRMSSVIYPIGMMRHTLCRLVIYIGRLRFLLIIINDWRVVFATP